MRIKNDAWHHATKQRVQGSELLELTRDVCEVHLAQEHLAAAVALEAELVKDLLRVLALLDALLVVCPEVSDRLSTAPAPHGDYHMSAPRVLLYKGFVVGWELRLGQRLFVRCHHFLKLGALFRTQTQQVLVLQFDIVPLARNEYCI